MRLTMPRRRAERAARALALAVALAGVATPAPAWEELEPPQQALLHEVREGWEALPEERRRHLATGAARWLRMTPAQREQARMRFESWQALAPAQQRVLLERREQFRALPLDDREHLRARFSMGQGSPERTGPLLTPEQGRQLGACLRQQAEGEAGDCRMLLPEAMRVNDAPR